MKRLVKKTGMTQKKLADTIGVSLNAVNSFINGRRTLTDNKIEEMAELIGSTRRILKTRFTKMRKVSKF